MKTLATLAALLCCFSFATLTGCGSGDTKVIEAPAETEDVDPAMEGMTEEEYNKAMEESMQ